MTAGNASGINDARRGGDAASGRRVKRRAARRSARLVGYGNAGVDPGLMGIGPVPATRRPSNGPDFSVDDLDVIEANEAFAAQACAVTRELEFDPAKVNPNGSGDLARPPGRGDRRDQHVKALYELPRTGGRYGAGHDVHRRRPGHRGDLRARLAS